MAVKGVIINPVLGAVVLSKGIVGLAGINPLGIFCVCVAYRQRLPTLAAFYQSGKQADFICLPRTLAGFQLVLHNVKAHAVNQRFMLSFHYNPVLRLLFPNRADFETVVFFLGSNRPGVDGIHQKVFDNGEVPHIPPVFRVFLFPFGAGIAKPPFPVPPCGAGDFFFLQPSADIVRTMTVQGISENQPHNRGGFLVNEQMVFVLRVFPIPKRGKTPGKLSFLRFQKIRGMDFLGNILAVHLIQDILERGNVVVIPQGVDTVIHGDIADTASWEKVLNQMPGLQIVTPQSAEVFRDDKVDLPALNGSQHSL